MNRKTRKPLIWLGSSKKDLIALSEDVQDIIGYGLGEAQSGRQASNAYVLKGFGSAGVLEIITHDRGGTYRGVYTVNFADIVFVLHVFQKKSKKAIETPKQDIDLIRQRLKEAEKIYKDIKHEK